MLAVLSLAVLLLAVLSGAWRSVAIAATITATVTDNVGKLLPNAVVMIAPEPGTPSPRPEDSRLATATIDQKNETFVPSVVVIRAGGAVLFHNSDKTRHHVYSFAPARRFEIVLAAGEMSAPVRFDAPGSVAIGCNIHDHMTAHVLVTGAPWAKVTDMQGKAVVDGLPAGRFVATVWHPRLRPGTETPEMKIQLTAENSALAVTLPVLPPRRPRPREY